MQNTFTEPNILCTA